MSNENGRRSLLLIGCAVLTLTVGSARAASTDDLSRVRLDSMDVDAPRELVLWFRYAGLIDTYVSARTDGEDVFLPLGEIFSLLRLHWSIDADAATGHFASEARPYRIDFKKRIAEFNGRSFEFGADDVILSARDAFLRENLLQEWFDLRFTANLGELNLALKSGEELPVERLSRRAAVRPALHDPYAVLRHAPLTYGRVRQDLSGGTMDYGLSVSQDARGTYMNVDAAVGAEILGGDVHWRVSGGHAQTAYFNQNYFLWRYVREDERLAQIRVGDLYATGLENVAYRGIHLTNLPASPKTYFAEYEVAGEAPSDWDVELYLDERLVGTSRGDPSGRYRFTVPLLYGTSMLRVKAYGPAGEEREELRRLQIPFSLLAPGELRYNVHAGSARNSGRLMAQADVGYGISDHLTATAGLEAIPRYAPLRVEGSLRRDVTQAAAPYVRFTRRISTHYLAGADFSAGGYRRLSVSGFLPSHASVEMSYVQFARRSAFIVDGRRAMLQAGGFLPFYVRSHPATVRLHASRIGFDDGAQYMLGASIFAGIRDVRLHLATRGQWSAGYRQFRVVPNISYTFSRSDGRIPRGTMITAAAEYDVVSGRTERMRLDVSQNLRPWSRLHVTVEGGLNGAPVAVGFRLSLDRPYARSTTSAGLRHGGSSLRQSIRGSIAFDEENRAFYFDRLPAVDRSSAAVRLFVDSDGDGRFDSGEPIVHEDAVRLKNGFAGSARRHGGISRISGLLPYARYTAAVDEALLSNPMLVPAQSAFSFIADPNVVKPIDIPLYTAGIVEGRVVEERDGIQHPVAGVVVRLVRRSAGAERILRTFSDGTYYEMGLPPGTYDVMVETDVPAYETLRDPEGATRTFTIEPAGEGAIVEDLDLVLRDPQATVARPLTQTSPSASRP